MAITLAYLFISGTKMTIIEIIADNGYRPSKDSLVCQYDSYKTL